MAEEICTKNSMHNICDNNHLTEDASEAQVQHSSNVAMPELLAAWRGRPVRERLREQCRSEQEVAVSGVSAVLPCQGHQCRCANSHMLRL